jgi:peptidyl-prolyl cis-trans isomerase SurA
MRNIFVVVYILLFLSSIAVAQDEVLLTIGKTPVMRSEFEYIFHKNNNVEGYEHKSVQDYLDLFINFKLKVLEARSLGYDTMRSFVNEFAGYKEQLARPYLQDKQVTNKLLEVAYYRTVNEVNASHIMVRLPANPSPADTLEAYYKIMSIRSQILAGESFTDVAKKESDDLSTRSTGGALGWFSAFNMVYPFETAAYQTAVGDVSMPVRSRYGYHLIRVNDKRPALGEIKLAHIMVRATRNQGEGAIKVAREKIYSYYDSLQAGKPFDVLARKYSEDGGTAPNGGKMRWLRSGELPPNIEELVFSLKDSGSYTEPVLSDYGWHIFQLQGKKQIPSFEQLKPKLEERIIADERGKLPEIAVIERIKKESGFKLYPENIDDLTKLIDSSVYEGAWNPAAAGELIEPVFSIDEQEYPQKNLADFIIQTKRYRKDEPIANIVQRKLEELERRELLAYEKGHLEEKYPEFKSLMEEYHDGILLFNIMDDMVWNKAAKDSIGLQSYFNKYRQDYKWSERASVSVYRLTDESKINMVRKLGRKRAFQDWSADKVKAMVCGNDSIQCIDIMDGTYEKGQNEIADQLLWKKGSVRVFREDGNTSVAIVNDLLPPGLKSLNEVRGQVTADYQNYLEQKWVAELRGKYQVVVNRDVLNKIN